MRRSTASKKSRRVPPSYNHIFLGGIVLSLGFVGLLSVASITMMTIGTARVLGSSTILAHGGDDAGSSSDTHGGGQGSSENSGPSEQHGGSSTPGINSTSQGGPHIPSNSTGSGNATPKSVSFMGNANGNDSSLERHHVMPPFMKGSSISGRLSMRPEPGEMQKGSESGETSPEIEHHTSGDVLRIGSSSARSRFPITLTASGTAVIQTPHGEKEIAILPDQALRLILTHHLLSHLDEGSSSAILTEKGDEPVFEISGVSQQHLFGFIPVSIHKSVDISATTGDTLSENESISSRILDFFSL